MLSASTGARKRRHSLRHWILLGATLLLVLAGLLPPLVNIGRYKRSIAASISRSIGRPVHMSSISLQLLPLPNFTMSDFVVEERPGFGAEPILRAASVVAYPRLSSLWRRRLEIARIDFDEASLNLVQGRSGSWNFGSILVQAARNPEAPTGQRHPGAAPRFPYIEATNSRINFKEGNEKKPLSFENADLSVWLENPDEWGLHFKAQPVRTDLVLDMADTGVLRIDGSLRRAATLNEMPIKLDARWTAAPLGQLSRLTLGQDIDWRGNLDMNARVTGSANLAHITAFASVNGLHRAEFVPAQPLNAAASCQASYSKASESFNDISCSSPVDNGVLNLTGYVRNMQAQLQTSLALAIHRVPASAMLAAVQEVRDGLGKDLQAVGVANGEFHYVSSESRPRRFSGEMGLSSLTLISPDSSRPLSLSPVRLQFEDRTAAAVGNQSHASPDATQPALLLQPIRLILGEPVPLTVDGRFTLDGFELHLSGMGAIKRLRGFSTIFAWSGAASAQPGSRRGPAALLGTSGSAALDLNVRGPWVLPVPDPEHPVAPFLTSGSVILKNAELTTSYFPQPVKIASAQGLLNPSGVTWTNASVSSGKLETQGTLAYPKACVAESPCSGHFQAATPALNLGQLQAALLGSSKDELLREILKHIDQPSTAWPPFSGILHIETLSAGKLALHNVTLDLQVRGNSMAVQSLDGRLFDGSIHLSGALDTSADQPKYTLDAQLTGASPAAFASLFGEHWGSGQADLSAQLVMSGLNAEELIQSAAGTLHWNWSKGALATQTGLPAATQPLLHFDSWHGDAAVADSTLSIDHSLLERGRAAIPLSGTISFNRDLDLKSDSPSYEFSVTGTLEHPRVKSLAAEAKLQPQ